MSEYVNWLKFRKFIYYAVFYVRSRWWTYWIRELARFK